MKLNGCVFSAWMVLSTVLYGSGAALETHYLHKLCRESSRVVFFDWTSTPSGIVKFDSYSGDPVNCEVVWKPNYRGSPVLSIVSYNLRPEDKLIIMDSDGFRLELFGRGHFPDERKSFSSEGRLTLHFTSTNSSDDDGTTKFQFVYTMARKGPCFTADFKCKNGKCIDKGLACDGHNHCGDRSEQKSCVPKTDREFDYSEVTVVKGRMNSFLITVIVVGVVFAIVLFSMIGVFIHRIKNKKAAQPSSPSAAAPTPSVHNVQQHPVNPSFFSQIRNSFRSRRNPNVEEAKDDLQRTESHQTPSMYPQTSLPMSEIADHSIPSTHQQQQPRPSFVSQIKNSFRSAKNRKVEEENEHKKLENHQAPSIYPEIPSAPELSGVDNPDFEIEE